MLFELQSDSAQSTASLEDYLEALRKRKYLALGFTCFGLLAGFGFANRQPTIYEAGARVLVNPTRVGSSNNSLVTPRPDREVAVLQGDETSKAAIDAASKQVPGASGSISVSFRPDSDAIGLVASSTNPQYSAALANAYVNTYVSRRVRDQQKFYDVSIESSNAEITQFQKRIAEAEARATDLDVRRGEIAKVAGGTSTQEYQSLSTTRDAIKQQVGSDYNSVRAAEQRVNELNRERSIQLPAASIVSSARVPDSPSGLPKWAYWFAGGFVGAILGTVAAFLRQRLDRSAQASSEVELALGSQVLGGVPAFGWRFRSGTSALVMANARPPRSIQRAQEAYRRLRGALMFLQRAGEARSIVFTSNHPMEGKSTTAANVALAVASGGSRSIVIDQLESIALATVFDAIVGAEDTLLHKPNPDVFLEAARRIEITPRQCLVFEDTDIGIEAACRAGMDYVDVRNLVAGPQKCRRD